jgi:hypothetical protein
MLRRLEHFCSFRAMRKANGKIARFQAFQRFGTLPRALLRSAPAKTPPRLGALRNGRSLRIIRLTVTPKNRPGCSWP